MSYWADDIHKTIGAHMGYLHDSCIESARSRYPIDIIAIAMLVVNFDAGE